MERWLVLVAVGVLLAALGLAIPYASFNRDVESEYWVGITAPEDVRWTLWLPMPQIPMTVHPQGTGVTLTETDTNRGPFYNMTGSGNASLAGTSRRFVFDMSPLEWQGERIVLSGAETGGGFWVWRQSDDGSAIIEVSAGSMWHASYLGGSIECGGPSFRGQPSEGWTLLAEPLGDCVQMLDGVPWLALAPVVLGLGAASMVAAAVSRRRGVKRRGEQVFLPPSA